jgi:hypothetical protein
MSQIWFGISRSEAQFVVDRVEDEIAFSLIGIPNEDMEIRTGVLHPLELSSLRPAGLKPSQVVNANGRHSCAGF